MKSFRFFPSLTTARRRAGVLRKNEDGSSTIEFVLWLPIFVLIMGVVVDTCFYFLAQSRLYDAAADSARRWAVGSMTQSEAETYAATKGGFRTTNATAAGSISGNTVTMVLTLPSSDVAITGVLGFVTADRITATVTHMTQ